jgi:hypothetical protein
VVLFSMRSGHTRSLLRTRSVGRQWLGHARTEPRPFYQSLPRWEVVLFCRTEEVGSGVVEKTLYSDIVVCLGLASDSVHEDQHKDSSSFSSVRAWEVPSKCE